MPLRYALHSYLNLDLNLDLNAYVDPPIDSRSADSMLVAAICVAKHFVCLPVDTGKRNIASYYNKIAITVKKLFSGLFNRKCQYLTICFSYS